MIKHLSVKEVVNPYIDNEERIFDRKEYIKKITIDLLKYGQINSVMINNKKEIISGRYLFEAIKELGWFKVIVEEGCSIGNREVYNDKTT